MKGSKQVLREAKQLFRSCLVNGRLEEARVQQAVQKVLQVKPRSYLQLLGQFKRLVKLDLERRAAHVETAVPLPADLEASVRATLTRTYGDGLSIAFSQNPALIGGMRVKVGSDVYDGSVRARLAALEESF